MLACWKKPVSVICRTPRELQKQASILCQGAREGAIKLIKSAAEGQGWSKAESPGMRGWQRCAAAAARGTRAGQWVMRMWLWARSRLSSQGETCWERWLRKYEEVGCRLPCGHRLSAQAGCCVDFSLNKLNFPKERPYCKTPFPLPAE